MFSATSGRKVPTTAIAATLFAVLIALSACGGGDSDDDDDDRRGSSASSASAEGSAPAVTPTGKNVDIKMISDSKGERYDPVEVEVHRGDNLRFILESGVHNVHFVPSKNPPGVKYPPMSEYLQLPGQKLEYLISFPEGRYYFQCDIHLSLGMVGYIEVEDSEDK